MQVSIAEFAENSFHNASIARIVETANIPRGSFYQYFDDLMDLYKYLFQLTAEKKLEYMHGVIANLERFRFFELMRELYAAGFRFASENPGLAAIGSRFFQEDRAVKQQIYAEFGEMSRSFFRELLVRGQERGEIDPKIDVEVAAFMMFALNISVMDHYLEELTLSDLLDNVDSFMNMADEILHILEHGMGMEPTRASGEGLQPSGGEETSCLR